MITSFQGEYRFLSNFYSCPVLFDGVMYPSVEAAYQSAKTLDLVLREPFRQMSAKDAKRAGKRLALRPDWDQVKVSIMETLLRDKFKPGSILGERLHSTGDQDLVEGNWWGDTFWGVCNGVGDNNLGKLLMRIRG